MIHVIACQTIINVKKIRRFPYTHWKKQLAQYKKNKAQGHVDVSKTDFHKAKRDVNDAKTNVK